MVEPRHVQALVSTKEKKEIGMCYISEFAIGDKPGPNRPLKRLTVRQEDIIVTDYYSEDLPVFFVHHILAYPYQSSHKSLPRAIN